MKKIIGYSVLVLISVLSSSLLVELFLHFSNYQAKPLLVHEKYKQQTSHFKMDSELIYTSQYPENNYLPNQTTTAEQI